LQNNHCNIHAAFLHHSNVLFHIHSLCLSIVMTIRFQGKLLWSTKSNPTDYCYDRTYMVVVMQLNVCHESPVTQSDIGSPDMEGFHLYTAGGSKRRGCEPWHDDIPQINVSSFAQCVVIWVLVHPISHLVFTVQLFDHLPDSSIMLVHLLLTCRLLVLASALAGSFSRLRFPRRLVGYFPGHRFS
jgi:hypothetical protein